MSRSYSEIVDHIKCFTLTLSQKGIGRYKMRAEIAFGQIINGMYT